MLRLLFVEDDPSAVEPVLNLIQREQADMEYEISAFDEAQERICSLRPDIVVLDLLVGGRSPEPKTVGLEIRDFIWDKHFCPIVVYSAWPDIYDAAYKPHPFVEIIQKGEGSPVKVLKALGEFRPHVEALHEAGAHIRQMFADAMKEVAPYAFNTFTDPNLRIETIKRAGRRRLATLMDSHTEDEFRLASWEQYVFPPVCPDTQLGDILRQADSNSDDPASFRLVLSPSCDLVASGGRTPKVGNVLVACCCSIAQGLNLTSLGGISAKKAKDRIPTALLSPGHFEGIIPFPRLEGQIPSMAANLRDLEFIPVDSIGMSGEPFLRVASIDSPFRELIAWAYLQVACRPGLPERDLDTWCEEIRALLADEGDET